MSFRKPKKLTIGERVEPPTISARQFDGTDEHAKAAKIAEKAREVSKQALSELPEAVREAVGDHLRVPRPDREAAVEDVRGAVSEVIEAHRSRLEPLVSYNSKRRDEAAEEIPDLTSGPAEPGESDVRQWVREANADERAQRIQTVNDSGNPAQARALYRSSIPAPVAGFADESQRRRMLDDALRSAAPESYETVKALTKDLAALERDRERLEQYAAQLGNAAMQTFDRVVAEHEARK